MTKKKRRNNKITNWPRVILQWSVIAFIVFLALRQVFNSSYTADFEAYCPFGGLQAVGSYFLSGSLSCTMTSTQMVMGILLLIGVILLSKLFCSYVCPVGTFSEFLGKAGERLKIRITIKGLADKLLRSLKYILLFLTLYFTLGSNELFCKEYDPFYAIASGYDTDVTALYATIAIAVTVLGAVFIRLFWCKYLCPLGAISNIFKFTWFFLAVMAVYLILLTLGMNIHFVWPLAAASLGGYIIELLGQRSRMFPVAKITRNEDTCTNCQMCTIKCPQAIDVASVKTVKHVDCNLCSDCLTVCPEENTLTINRRKGLKWMPAIAIVVLFALGLFLQSFWEIPTINESWGEPGENAQMTTYSREGLKNIKCYGSSKAFESQMRKVNGVYGVATFVGTKKVEITYDQSIISEEKLEESLFTPSKTVLRTLPAGTETLTEVSFLLENFFDTYDFSYLARLLQQETKATAVLSEFACPVIVKIYFPADAEMDDAALKEVVESEVLRYEVQDKSMEVELNFEVVGDFKKSQVEKGAYIVQLFDPFVRDFNDAKKYDSTVISIYSIPMGKNARLTKRLPYLVSHLSNNDGIIRLETRLNEEYKQVIDISYIDTMTNALEVFGMISADSLKVSYTSGKQEMVENMFDFSEQ
ncbi:MAG: 4Fe-4S binding protein [Bacteroidales bacterium]|nr:4Fe-4S binding protein [Bacteroidales bacterium]MDT8430757.1 4Fe-4S binding protein [Bacteroidales bacterium]